MKYFILSFLFIPLSFAGSPPDCGELGKIIEGYETDLQKKFIGGCGSLDHKIFIKDIPVKDESFLEGKVCSDLATIETELENLNIQEAVLTGINKLKVTIQESKAKTEAKNSEAQRVAGMSFVDSLNTAQSLEVLLQSVTPDGDPFVKKLKEFPEHKRLSQKDLSDRVAELCIKMNKSEANACNSKVFKPSPRAATELLDLINSTDATVEQISKWQGMLAIKRKNPTEDESETYSFSEMQNDLSGAFDKIDKDEVMSKEHIAAIQKLDDFENAVGLSFVEDIADLKDKSKAKIASDKFFLLMGDARLRQQYEIQSKLSIVWEDVEKILPQFTDTQKEECSRAKALFNDAKSCLRSLEEAHSKMTGDTKANLARLLPALRVSVDYADALESKETVCREEIKSEKVATEVCYADFNEDLGIVQDKILQLNILKDKIGSENLDLMKFRNFALMKWKSQKCQTLSSPMDFCEDDSLISKEVMMTYSDTMKIAVAFAPKPEAEEDAELLCEEEDRTLKKAEERLCEFFNDTTSDIVETDNTRHLDGPVAAPDGGNAQANIRDAWIQGGSNILKDVLGQMMTNVNPRSQYPYNYSPYNNGRPPMGISDSILFNARYHGAYGFYMPTPGHQPYTAFGVGSSFAQYTPVSSMGGKFFNF